MADGKEVVQGVIAFFIGILATIVSWYLVNIFDDVMVGLGVSNTIRALLWVGVLTVFISAVIVYPYLKITRAFSKS